MVVASLRRGAPGPHSRLPAYSVPASNRQLPIVPILVEEETLGSAMKTIALHIPEQRKAESRESQTGLSLVTSPVIWSPDAGGERLGTTCWGEPTRLIIQWPSTGAPGPPQRGSCHCYFGGHHIFLMTCKISL